MAERPYESPPARWAPDRFRAHRFTARLVIGLAFLALGVLWTLDNLGLMDADPIVRWWPLLLVAFGAAKIVGWGTCRSTFAGALWLIAGSWLVLHALGVVRYGLAGLWPLALVAIGGRIVLRAVRAPAARYHLGPAAANADADGRIKLDAVMSGVERRMRGGVFRGGEINAVMANVSLDLRDATLAEGRAELEANAVLGGIVITVPRGWAVVSEVSSVMGSVEDHTEHAAEGEPRDTLILKGAAVMGGVETRN